MKLTEEVVLAKTHCESLAQVRRINMWGEHLTDISLVSQMPNLEIASFSVNSITTIQHFSSCLKLREVYVRKNNISDLSEIGHLRGLGDLRVLWLSDNPCSADSSYRLTVIRTLPSLELLDNTRVTDEERQAAAECTLQQSEPVGAESSGPISSDLIETSTPNGSLPYVNNNSSLLSESACNGHASGEQNVQSVEALNDEQASSGAQATILNDQEVSSTNVPSDDVGNEQPSEDHAASSEEEVNFSAYWQGVASQILTRCDNTPPVVIPANTNARLRRRARRSRPENQPVLLVRNGSATTTDRPVTRKNVASRRDAKLISAITSLIDIIDDPLALTRIREAVDLRLSTMANGAETDSDDQEEANNTLNGTDLHQQGAEVEDVVECELTS